METKKNNEKQKPERVRSSYLEKFYREQAFNRQILLSKTLKKRKMQIYRYIIKVKVAIRYIQMIYIYISTRENGELDIRRKATEHFRA